MQVTGLGWAGVLTDDFGSTVRFFSEALGLSLAYLDQAKELAHFRFHSGQLFEIYGSSNRQRKEKYQWFHGPALGFEVNDIELAYQEMTARGTRFITDLEAWEDDRWALFLGPQDTLFEILQPARKLANRFEPVQGIRSAKLSVQDLVGATHFFSEVLEMSSTKAAEQDMTRFCLPAGHSFEVCRANAEQRITVGFAVAEMIQARCAMESKGVKFLGSVKAEDDGTSRSRFCGPDQSIYELVYRNTNKMI